MTKEQKAHQLIDKACLAQMLGHLEEAADLYRLSLTIHPTAEAYTFLGWASSLKGNLEDAIDLCRRAIETDPELGNAYSDISAYLIQLDRYPEAMAWLRKAVRARRFTSLYSIHFNLGRIYEALGREARALDAYRNALKECPECAVLHQTYHRLISRTC